MTTTHELPVAAACRCAPLSRSAYYKEPDHWAVRDAEIIAVLAELVARVKALLRRRGSTATFSSETITVGPLEVDIPGRRARVEGVDVDLTKREFDLLAVLAEHKTAVLSRAQLLELVWGYDFAADTNVVDVFIGYLRRKLEAGGAPRLLHTVRGVGFVLRQQ